MFTRINKILHYTHKITLHSATFFEIGIVQRNDFRAELKLFFSEM